MSDVKTTSGAGTPTLRGPFSAPTPLGAGLDVGVGVAVLEVSEVSEVEVPTSRDALDSAAAAQRRDVPKPTTERASNVFAALARDVACAEVVPRELVDERVPLDTTLEVDWALLGDLVRLEIAGAGQLTEALQKVRTGLLLVGHDAREHVPSGVLTVAEKLWQGNVEAAKSALVTYLKKDEVVQDKVQRDVNQLVLRVLREAYLMTTEVLRDRAEQVKFYNEQRKKVRELAKEARETQAKWAALRSASGGGDAWVAPEPFTCRLVDPVTGEIYTEKMSAADVEAFNAIGTAPQAALSAQALSGPSRLSASERAFLDKAYEDKSSVGEWFFDSANDDWIEENLNKLLAIIPKMNARELDKYIPQFFSYLTGGDTNEKEILAIVEALTPEQVLYLWMNILVVSLDSGFNGRERATLELAVENAKAELRTKLPAEFHAMLDKDPRSCVTAYERAMQREEHVTTAEQSVAIGAARQVNRPDQLEAHIKALEELLNSVGDDAQLANVDLQNELQKQQQTLQMMSNILKNLHDTALSVIRKVGN